MRSGRRAQWDRDRGSFRERGYSARWDRARLQFLKMHPLCVMCVKDGMLNPAQVVDHIVPHKGDQKLFWDQKNWQSLCKSHHNLDKQREERGRPVQKVGDDGWPLDEVS